MDCISRWKSQSWEMTHGNRLSLFSQWLSYLPLDPRFAGLIPAGVDGFSERKNPEYDFHRKDSKAVGPMS